MRRVRDRDTTPELAFRRALHARGLRYRVHASELPGKPDVVFPRRRVAIFIDGDFWHGGQWETRGLRRLEQQFTRTETRDYWLRKIRRTMQRDAANTASLQAMGWTALRFWESDIRRALDECVEMTVGVLDMSDDERSYTPLAEKSVALRSSQPDVWQRGLEPEGWRIARPASDADGHAGAVTLTVGELGDEIGPLGSPLVLLDGDMEALLAQGGDAFRQGLPALIEHGYQVDAFVSGWGAPTAPGGQRLFVAAALAAVQRTPALKERGSAYIASASEPSEARPPELVELIQACPEVDWRLRALPPLPSGDADAVQTVAWIASMYLNPLVNAMLRGQPLYPKV